MEKKDVYFVINSLNPGGMQTVLRILTEGLYNEFTLSIIYFSGKEFNLKGVKYFKLEKKKRVLNLFNFFKVKNKEAIVIPLGMTRALDFLFLKFFLNIKLIATERNDPEKKLENIKKYLIKKLIRNSDFLVVQNQYQYDYYKKYIKESKILIIKNPIKISNKIHFKNGNNLLSIGRYTDQKNQGDLIKIVSKLDTESKLFLIGYGENEKKLKNLTLSEGIQDKIIFCKSIDDIDLNTIGLFVSTSLYEGLPNVILESLNMGLRCIQYDFNGNEFKTNLITSIKPGNINKFIFQIKNEILNKNIYSESNFKNALKPYSHIKIINEWGKLIKTFYTK